jgi:hypothetical protein
MRYVSIFIFVFILCLAQAAALSTDLKSTYSAKETMIIKITGNIVQPIDASQVIFKRNNIFVPLEYDVGRVGEQWYVWAIAPQTSANYSFSLQNIVTSSGSGVKNENYQKNFSVSQNMSSYNVKPGFIISDEDFPVTIEVFSETINSLSTNFPSSQEFNVEYGQNTVMFPIGSKTTGSYTVQIGTYSIPAFLTVSTPNTPAPQNQTNQTQTNTTIQNQTQQNNETTNTTVVVVTNNSTQNQTNNTAYTTQTNASSNLTVSVEQQIFQVSPSYVQRLLYKEAQSSTYSFWIYNPSSTNYKDIAIIYNKTLFDIKDDEFNLKANATYSLNVTLGKYPGYDLRELIYLNATNFTIEVPFFVRYTNNATDLVTFYGEYERNSSTNVTKRKTAYYCTELGGIVCATASTCKGQSLESKEGNCCLGICQQPANTGSSWWGWAIGIVALMVIIWIYMKYKKAAPSADISGISP